MLLGWSITPPTLFGAHRGLQVFCLGINLLTCFILHHGSFSIPCDRWDCELKLRLGGRLTFMILDHRLYSFFGLDWAFLLHPSELVCRNCSHSVCRVLIIGSSCGALLHFTVIGFRRYTDDRDSRLTRPCNLLFEMLVAGSLNRLWLFDNLYGDLS